MQCDHPISVQIIGEHVGEVLYGTNLCSPEAENEMVSFLANQSGKNKCIVQCFLALCEFIQTSPSLKHYLPIYWQISRAVKMELNNLVRIPG